MEANYFKQQKKILIIRFAKKLTQFELKTRTIVIKYLINGY